MHNKAFHHVQVEYLDHLVKTNLQHLHEQTRAIKCGQFQLNFLYSATTWLRYSQQKPIQYALIVSGLNIAPKVRSIWG